MDGQFSIDHNGNLPYLWLISARLVSRVVLVRVVVRPAEDLAVWEDLIFDLS